MNKDEASHTLPLSSVLMTKTKHKMYIGLRREHNYCCNSNELPQSSKQLSGCTLVKMKALSILECECNKGRGKNRAILKEILKGKKKIGLISLGDFACKSTDH